MGQVHPRSPPRRRQRPRYYDVKSKQVNRVIVVVAASAAGDKRTIRSLEPNRVEYVQKKKDEKATDNFLKTTRDR